MTRPPEQGGRALRASDRFYAAQMKRGVKRRKSTKPGREEGRSVSVNLLIRHSLRLKGDYAHHGTRASSATELTELLYAKMRVQYCTVPERSQSGPGTAGAPRAHGFGTAGALRAYGFLWHTTTDETTPAPWRPTGQTPAKGDLYD